MTVDLSLAATKGENEEDMEAASVLLRRLIAEHPHERISLDDLLNGVGHRAFGLLLLLLALPNSIPLPAPPGPMNRGQSCAWHRASESSREAESGRIFISEAPSLAGPSRCASRKAIRMWAGGIFRSAGVAEAHPCKRYGCPTHLTQMHGSSATEPRYRRGR